MVVMIGLFEKQRYKVQGASEKLVGGVLTPNEFKDKSGKWKAESGKRKVKIEKIKACFEKVSC
ncbi:MAG: hypothetical protein HOK55_00665 [Gammaproteobacteria bacterium]|nr:hypothetical protein [Gammaproteobacteria bacterium]